MLKTVASATIAVLALTGAALAQSAPGNAVVFAVFENPEPQHGCIVSERDRDGGYDKLVIGRCDSPAALFVFDERAKRIRPANRPSLCMGDTTGAGDAPFDAIARDCAPNGLGQFYTYNRGSKRIVALTEDNREERDGFCLYVGPQRNRREPIYAEPCNSRRLRTAQINFFITPANAIARGPSAMPAPSMPSPAMGAPGMPRSGMGAPGMGAPGGAMPAQGPAGLMRSPWGRSGSWTIDSSRTQSGFSACRAVGMSNSGEIRVGLNAQLDMTMSVPADAAMAPPGTRASVTLRAGSDRESVPGSVNAEGRLGFTVPPPVARTMVERPLREMFVEAPDGMSSVPMAGFRALWDELNACVSAQGQR
ncbi:hypothetical protein E8L99_23260 [Phreatobacter aquaticus]|uniref:Ricin B lectin domain-containing protein n=1 Tax=Phreatobacter aquaticus TaxID=2570229 RepID=A0A4D7QTT7_9HYPH|nr:hypothetical protein [Phreatobacter aquaticus]QCK88467.1 hypothetical protein E8L99_23260 [Phreatobacter aquaticus]